MIQDFFYLMKRATPSTIKNLIPTNWRTRLEREITTNTSVTQTKLFPLLKAPLELPSGETEEALFSYLAGFHIEDEASEEELRWYLREAFFRFLYTLQLVPRQEGKLLEVGAGPYFISLLLRRFTSYELSFTNFFGDTHPQRGRQIMVSTSGERNLFDYYNVNVEKSPLPFPDHTFDVVLMCEVLEHFTYDTHQVLLHLKQVLKPGGLLILTTPNANRLENVARMLAGTNVFAPYSGHGPYGRHNREYNVQEVQQLLAHVGFKIETIFTSDIGENKAGIHYPLGQLLPLLKHRQDALGEYIFVRARNDAAANPKKPRWLYTSYPAHLLAD